MQFSLYIQALLCKNGSPEWEYLSNYMSFITDSAFSDVQAASSTDSDQGHSVISGCIQNPVDQQSPTFLRHKPFYVWQYFHGLAFKVTQINTTKTNSTSVKNQKIYS